MKKLFLLSAFLVLVLVMQSLVVEPPKTETAISVSGLQLMEDYCFNCHSPRLEEKVAPSMSSIKDAYLKKSKDKSSFVTLMGSYMKHPSSQTAQMPEAVQKFGMMPKLPLSEEQVQAIASFLYDTDLANPKWSEQKAVATADTSINYADKGLSIVMKTKAILGKNLMSAINSMGTERALEFCNTKAIPLTDSMSTILKASVKRVSDRPRNANNAANEEELAQINQYKQQLAANQKTAPVVRDLGKSVIVYVPIETNKMCLQCHGMVGQEIVTTTHEKIQKLYPKDKAVGYGESQIRGLFVVTMQKR